MGLVSAADAMQAGVLSLLTAVLLNASPTCTPAEASSRALPPNFVEAAHLVMTVLNNLCRLDLQAGQYMLSCAHHRMEFYHLISFLLSYCLSRWPAPVPATAHSPAAVAAAAAPEAAEAAATGPTAHQPSPPAVAQQRCHLCQNTPGSRAGQAGRGCTRSCSSSTSASASTGEPCRSPATAAVLHHPIAQLLNQVLLLIGLFCVQHPSNQAMLTWGRSPSILQRLCSLPREYLSVPELRAVLMPTLLCVCFGAERSCEIVAQHFDLEELLQYVQQEHEQLQRPAAPQQPARHTRQERRRQRRAQQRQEQQDVGQPPHSVEEQQQLLLDLEQQLPAQAQHLLQQAHACCNSDSVQQPLSTGGSCSSSNADSSGAGCTSSNSSSSPARIVQPARGRHIRFALCRRFPVQLLTSASQQLQQTLLSRQASDRHNQCAPLGLPLGLPAVAAANSTMQPCQNGQQEQQQQQQKKKTDPEQQPTAAGAQPALPAADEAVALQLQLQRAPAKLVRCEVVACS